MLELILLPLSILNATNLQQTDNNIWKESPISKEHAIKGSTPATPSEEGYEHTASLLIDILGFN